MGKTKATNFLRLIAFGLVIILFVFLDEFLGLVSCKLIVSQHISYLLIVLAHIQLFELV